MTWHDHVLHFARQVYSKAKEVKEKLKRKKEAAKHEVNHSIEAHVPKETKVQERSVMITHVVNMHKRRVERKELILRATAPIRAQHKLGRHARHRRLIQHATSKFRK